MKTSTRKLGFVVTSFLLVFSLYAVAQTSASALTTDQTELVITYALPYEFTEELSVWEANSYATNQWTSAIYNGLLKRESQTRAWIPELAANMPDVSTSLLNFTFDLKPGLKFENGDALTADDVVFSYKMALTAAINNAGYATLAQYMTNDSIVKIDDDTVQFNLESTYAFALGLFSSQIVSQEHWQSHYDACVGAANATASCPINFADGSGNVGTAGPFKFQSIDSTNQVLTVVRNPNYWNAEAVEADKIVYLQIEDKTGAISALAGGDIDIMDAQYIPGLTELIGIDGVIDKFVGSPSHQEISPNHQHPMFGTGDGIPHDGDLTNNASQALDVRRAMSHIVQRDFFVDEVMEGLAQEAATAMPSASQGWDPTLLPDTYNITLAREYMVSAGFDFADIVEAGDFGTSGEYETFFFNMTVLAPNTNPARNQWSSAWKDELAKIGIGVTAYVNTGWDNIVPRTFGWSNDTLVPLYEDSGYDVLFVGYGWALDWDPTGLYDSLGLCSTGSCDNFYNYQNATVEALIQDYAGELDFDARNTKVKTLQQALYDDLPVIPILYPQEHWAWDDELTGIDALLLSSSSQNWDEVRKSSWPLRVITEVSTTVDVSTQTQTDTATETDTDTVVNTETEVETSTVVEGPVASLPIILGVFGSFFIATVARRRR